MDRFARPTRLPFGRAVVASALVVALLAAATRVQAVKGDAAVDTARSSPTATTVAPRLSRPAVNGSSMPPLAPAAQRAVERLAATSQRLDGPGHEQSGHVGHLFGPAEEVPLASADADLFGTQWAAAHAVLAKLDTTEEAAAAGYVLSSTMAPGVGVHWVDWELIAKPFDPARPSMLLFARARGVDRLIGFSYWVQSAEPPAGFAGPNDHWHTHAGLCVVNGWVDRENVASAAECPGSLLAGDDLWMLHTWLVDDYPNRWGQFAQANPTLCPTGPVPDLASCTPDVG